MRGRGRKAQAYGVVVHSVNVSVLLYVPVRSASVGADVLLELIVDRVVGPAGVGQQVSGEPTPRPPPHVPTGWSPRPAAATAARTCR